MLEGLVEAVQKGYCVDSSYKANGQKITLNYTLAVTQQLVTVKQIKTKHNNYKKDQKLQKELYGLFSQKQDEDKGMPVASEKVIKAYFKANPAAEKFCYMPPAFLNLLQELFNRILAIGNYIRLINKTIKSCIDLELLLVVALQALGLVNKENEDKEEVDKAFDLELALSSIKCS